MANPKIVFDPPLGGDEGIVLGSIISRTKLTILVTVDELVVYLHWPEERIMIALGNLTERNLVTGNQFGWWPNGFNEVEIF